ncbi:hypothetical protein [Pseudonocardia oroxyli]|uniref:Uncharacterized protein n=1 Tax=Pseudonocardia oroxyli TaxID=366584 RepID=A0A1G7ZEE4_PSEOR|nr:hypothetical protein [Pseudonocardia oroxyli]SDH06480.1 hypothetical protein SAMN05216377_11899 [Pseudonocardia oroxyli]
MNWVLWLVVGWVAAAAVVGVIVGLALRRTGREPLEHELLEAHLLVSDQTTPRPDPRARREPSPRAEEEAPRPAAPPSPKRRGR